MNLKQTEILTNNHFISEFSSGIKSLDDWLKNRALANQNSGATRTFVTCVENRVVGYYAIASGAITIQQALGKFRRNMPNPIPVIVLARLAVDSSYQNRGLGRALFRDAALRVIQSADIIGIRGIIVHAISEQARDFYVALGFNPSPLEPMTLMITLNDLKACISQG